MLFYDWMLSKQIFLDVQFEWSIISLALLLKIIFNATKTNKWKL